MKKFFKYYLPTLIFLSAICVFLFGYMITCHIAISHYLAGEMGLEEKGNLITTRINAVIKEDDVEQRRAKVFESNGKLYLVFEKFENLGFGVLIFDKERKDIFVPVSGNCYELLFSKYLFQSECGQRGDYMSGEKHERYQVKLESNDSQINFQLPVYNYGKVERHKKMEIIFQR